MREIKLQDLKSKTPAELVAFAEENGVENASTMRKQELMFAILKQLAIQETDRVSDGVMPRFKRGNPVFQRRLGCTPPFLEYWIARPSRATTVEFAV